MCTMFEVAHPTSYWMNQFNERIWQRQEEMADAFVSDLRLLATKAFPTLLLESETFVYARLRCSMTNREKEWCFNRSADTPTDVLRVLEQVHQIERESDHSNHGKPFGGHPNGNRRNKPVPPSPSFPDSSLTTLPTGANSIGDAFTPKGRGGGSGGGFRRWGGVFGGGGGGRGQNRDGPTAETMVKCYNCGQFGHYKQFCPKPHLKILNWVGLRVP